MRITENEQENRRERMLRAAYKLFCKDGIDGVSIPQIAEAAGVGRNSVFRYFENKTELVHCTQILLWQEISDILLSDRKDLCVNAKNGWEEVQLLLSGFKDLYENHSSHLLFACDYKLFLIRNHILISKSQHKIVMLPIFPVFIDALERGRMDGSISKSDSVKIQFFRIWGIMRGYSEEIVIYDRMYGGKNPWKDQFDFVLRRTMDTLNCDITRGNI